MSPKIFENQLAKLGFSDKEAKVYLASLEIGPSPVQKISQKAGVKRATTYVMIQSLMDRGLMSSYEKGKKTFFAAEKPSRLNNIIENERASVESRKAILDEILPTLLSFGAHEQRPMVSFFEGLEGLKAIHDDVLRTTDKSLENIVALDDALSLDVGDEHVSDLREKLAKKGVGVRILYSSKNRKLDLPSKLRWQVRKMPIDVFPIHGELTLYGDKVAAFSYRGKIFGTIVESKEIAQTIRVLFELAWTSTKIKTEA